MARLKLFYAEAKESTSVGDVAAAIEAVRSRSPIQPYEPIPI